MTLTNRFLQFISHYNPKHPWLIAVSGGVDSIVLCNLCLQHNIPFAIAHCNFQLRAEESQRDQQFVTEFAKSNNIRLHLKIVDTNAYMQQTGTSVQVAARDLRYAWFNELLTEGEAAVLATAHHANDNLETVLMNLFRGTGIKGLRGIQPVQGKIIRPLLQATKEELLDYAEVNSLSWVEDSSNNTDKYTRNFIRHQIIPLMEQAIPRDEIGFGKSLELLGEAELLYNEAVELHKKKLLEVKGNEVHIPVLKLAKAKPLRTIVYEISRDFGFTAAQTDDVLSLLNAESGKYVASPTHRIIRNRAWLIIAPRKTEEANHILIEETDSNVAFANGTLTVQKMSNETVGTITNNANIALLDAASISFPLILRPWKAGDYFYPLGMPKKKKLARFFIDQKLSKTDKEKVWVIESDKRILWVVGYRVDDRFKVGEGTGTFLNFAVEQR